MLGIIAIPAVDVGEVRAVTCASRFCLRVIAVNSTGKAMISITARNAARVRGKRAKPYSRPPGAVHGEAKQVTDGAFVASAALPITVGYRLHGER